MESAGSVESRTRILDFHFVDMPAARFPYVAIFTTRESGMLTTPKVDEAEAKSMRPRPRPVLTRPRPTLTRPRSKLPKFTF